MTKSSLLPFLSRLTISSGICGSVSGIFGELPPISGGNRLWKTQKTHKTNYAWSRLMITNNLEKTNHEGASVTYRKISEKRISFNEVIDFCVMETRGPLLALTRIIDFEKYSRYNENEYVGPRWTAMHFNNIICPRFV